MFTDCGKDSRDDKQKDGRSSERAVERRVIFGLFISFDGGLFRISQPARLCKLDEGSDPGRAVSRNEVL